jgi:hypothetical protein
MSTPFKIQQLAKKIRLEENVKPKLTSFFRDIGKQIGPVMRATGRPPQLAIFRDELIELLSKHYDRVSKAFQGDVAPNLTKGLTLHLELKQEEAERVIDDAQEEVDEALLALIALRAPRQADFILETTEKELNDATTKAVVEAAKKEETLTNSELSRKVTQDFNSRTPGRVETISITETQAMAEDTKLTEAQTIANSGVFIAGVSAVLVMRKIWNTILDERTRSSHVLADNQERSMVQPFLVQGQRLKVPGDTSLGATLDNVINCRCAAEYKIGGLGGQG